MRKTNASKPLPGTLSPKVAGPPNETRSHAHPRPDDGNAFFPDPQSGPAHTVDETAEQFAENYLISATTGESQSEESLDQVEEEEEGGPFLETSAQEEFAGGTDPMNPADAAREPFPIANRYDGRKENVKSTKP